MLKLTPEEELCLTTIKQNRYRLIGIYSLFSDDHNCVKLETDEDNTEGYVNASYIHVSYIHISMAEITVQCFN